MICFVLTGMAHDTGCCPPRLLVLLQMQQLQQCSRVLISSLAKQ